MTNSGQNEKIDVSKSFIFRIYNMLYLRAESKSIHRLKEKYLFVHLFVPDFTKLEGIRVISVVMGATAPMILLMFYFIAKLLLMNAEPLILLVFLTR